MVADTTFRILGLCSRAVGHLTMRQRLAAELADADWENLLVMAETYGLDPLLYRHLVEADCPTPSFARARLQARWVQHAHAAVVRGRVLAEVIRAFDADGIPCLVSKGTALAQLVYPDPVLRPMRDVDLLVRPVDAARALCHGVWRRGRGARV